MKLIACVDSDWGIGYDNELLVKIPEHLSRFEEETLGKTLVCGGTTLSKVFPNGQPLEGRNHIILSYSHGKSSAILEDGSTVEWFTSFHDVRDRLLTMQSNDIFIVGGEQIFKQFLPYCDKAYITRMLHSFNANRFIPNLSTNSDWCLTKSGDFHVCEEGFTYFFEEYVRIKWRVNI